MYQAFPNAGKGRGLPRPVHVFADGLVRGVGEHDDAGFEGVGVGQGEVGFGREASEQRYTIAKNDGIDQDLKLVDQARLDER